MLKYLTFSLALLLLSTGSAADPSRPKLLVLGDSLSAAYGIPVDQGWVALLANYLHQDGIQAEVINASISGDTTRGGLSRLAPLLHKHQPDFVIIELGANDGLRGFPLKAMRDNLRQLIQLSRQSGASVLLLGMRIPPNYGAKYTSTFFDSFGQLAREESIPLVPFFLEGVAGHTDLIQDDGLHPRAQAQPIMLDHVLAKLLPLMQADRALEATP